VDERWILNASPVIVLAHTGYTHLFASLADSAAIPEAVAAEIRSGPRDDPARKWIEAGSIAITNTPAPSRELLAWDLGAGETAVLAYALANPGCIAILDDAAARKCAQSFSVPLLGTLAIVVRAKQRGLISSAAEAIKALRSAGFRISDQVISAILKNAVQEDWVVEDTS
jgi:predicted nucleic acid-binding protein